MKATTHRQAWLSACRALPAVSVAVCTAACVANCAQHTQGFRPDSSSDGGTGVEASAGDAAVAADTGWTGSFGDGGDAGRCNNACSSDLHTLVDCAGNVLATCPPDQACSPSGGCLPACAGADANKSSLGCDFFAVTTAPGDYNRLQDVTGDCYVALIANTWSTSAQISLAYGGMTLDASQFIRIPQGSGAAIVYEPLPAGGLPPGALGIAFLSSFEDPAFADSGAPSLYVGCPVTPAISDRRTAAVRSSIGQAFEIKTTVPVVAYDMYPYGGAKSYVTSASLLLPTSAWGTNYVMTDGFVEEVFGRSNAYIQVAASQDGTQVTILPSAPLTGSSTLPGTPRGVPRTYTLDRGQFVQFQQAGLSGSVVSASAPVAAFGGNGCTNLPAGYAACDSLHQQLPPVSAMGSTYVAVHYRDREPGANEAPPWRVMGVVDGTVLTFNPPIGVGPFGKLSLNKGDVVDFDEGTAFVVTSQDDQHPFYMSGHMTGADYVMPAGQKNGDPDFVNVVPAGQYLKTYTFLTDPTYANTNLVFVRQKSESGEFKDVTLDCAGVVGPWSDIGQLGSAYQFVRVDVVTNGVAQGGCANGVHAARSDAPFGLTVWGFDEYVSYAYAAGMSVKPINAVTVPTK